MKYIKIHDVIFLVKKITFSFSQKSEEKTMGKYFQCIFPPEGSFDIDAGNGLRGKQNPQNPKNVPKTVSYGKCSHFWDSLFFFQKKSKNIFEISSYMQKMTKNPINALKYQFVAQNTPKIQKYISRKSQKIRIITKKSKRNKCLSYYISNVHNSYFVYFVYFIHFVYFVYM